MLRYATLAVPIAFLGLPLYVFIPQHYASMPNLGLWEVGLVLLLARLLDLITDPLIGRSLDKWRGRFHSYQWIVVGAVIAVLGVVALFNPPQDPGLLWLGVSISLTYLGWSLVSVPYLAWGAELSNDLDGHRNLASAREFATLLGALCAVVVLGLSPEGLTLVSLLFAGLIALGLVLLSGVPRVSISACFSRVGFWSGGFMIKRLLLLYLLNALAAGIPGTLFLLYAEEVLGLSSAIVGVVLIVYFVAGVLGVPLWLAIAKRFGTLRSWAGSMLIAASGFLPVLLLGEGDLWPFIGICLVTGLSLGADVALPAAVQSSLARRHSIHRDHPAEGEAFGYWGLAGKLALALAVGLGFPLLDWASTMSWREPGLVILYGLVPIMFKLLTLLLLWRWMDGFQEVLNDENDSLAAMGMHRPVDTSVERVCADGRY